MLNYGCDIDGDGVLNSRCDGTDPDDLNADVTEPGDEDSADTGGGNSLVCGCASSPDGAGAASLLAILAGVGARRRSPSRG